VAGRTILCSGRTSDAWEERLPFNLMSQGFLHRHLLSNGNAHRQDQRWAFFALLASALRLGRDYEAAYRQHTCGYAAAIPRDFADVYVLKFTLFSPRITLLL